MAGTTADVARWTNGAGTGVVTTPGNWSVESGAPSTPPTAGETALFDSRANGDVVSGSITGLGQIIGRGYSGNFGTSGTSVTLSATTVYWNCFGTYYWICTATTFTLDGTNGGKVYFTGGTITTLYGDTSAIDEGASAVTTTAKLTNCVLTAAAGTAFTTLQLRGGTGRVSRNVATLDVDGNSRLTTTLAAANTTTGTVHPGSVWNHQSSGTIAALVNYGTFTPVGSPFSFTISDLSGPKNAKTVTSASGGVVVTVTADNRWGSETSGGSGNTGLGA